MGIAHRLSTGPYAGKWVSSEAWGALGASSDSDMPEENLPKGALFDPYGANTPSSGNGSGAGVQLTAPSAPAPAGTSFPGEAATPPPSLAGASAAASGLNIDLPQDSGAGALETNIGGLRQGLGSRIPPSLQALLNGRSY